VLLVLLEKPGEIEKVVQVGGYVCSPPGGRNGRGNGRRRGDVTSATTNLHVKFRRSARFRLWAAICRWGLWYR
jgi:hypothetical protein